MRISDWSSDVCSSDLAVLRLPLVVGRHADAGLPADVLDRHAGIGLLEDRDDLGIGETGLLHGTSWLGKTCQKVLLMGCLRFGEASATCSATNSLPQASTQKTFPSAATPRHVKRKRQKALKCPPPRN